MNMITKKELSNVVLEQKLNGFSDEAIDKALDLSNKDLITVKHYFSSVFNKVSTMSLSSTDNNLKEEIEKIKKNIEAITIKTEKYYAYVEPYEYGEMNPAIKTIYSNADEMDEFVTMLNDLVDVMDVFVMSSRGSLRNYLKNLQ